MLLFVLFVMSVLARKITNTSNTIESKKWFDFLLQITVLYYGHQEHSFRVVSFIILDLRCYY